MDAEMEDLYSVFCFAFVSATLSYGVDELADFSQIRTLKCVLRAAAIPGNNAEARGRRLLAQRHNARMFHRSQYQRSKVLANYRKISNSLNSSESSRGPGSCWLEYANPQLFKGGKKGTRSKNKQPRHTILHHYATREVKSQPAERFQQAPPTFQFLSEGRAEILNPITSQPPT